MYQGFQVQHLAGAIPLVVARQRAVPVVLFLPVSPGKVDQAPLQPHRIAPGNFSQGRFQIFAGRDDVGVGRPLGDEGVVEGEILVVAPIVPSAALGPPALLVEPGADHLAPGQRQVAGREHGVPVGSVVLLGEHDPVNQVAGLGVQHPGEPAAFYDDPLRPLGPGLLRLQPDVDLAGERLAHRCRTATCQADEQQNAEESRPHRPLANSPIFPIH